jgi:hypothetical protein
MYQGLKQIDVETAEAGDIVAIAGFDDIHIGDVLTDPQNPVALPPVEIEPPTIKMTFGVNTSPFDLAGQFEIGCGHFLRALDREGYSLRLVSRDTEADTADIEENGYNIFFHTLDGRELVCNAWNLHMCDSGTREGREDNATEAVAERIAVARVETVNLVRTGTLRFGNDTRLRGQSDVIVRHDRGPVNG